MGNLPKKQDNHAIHIKTIFCDIDGCIFKHLGNIQNMFNNNLELLPGTIEKFTEWITNGYTIIMVTGRPESMRDITTKQLNMFGIPYKQLVMGLPRGQRVIINDIKDYSQDKTAKAINLKRNEGMLSVKI